MKRIARSALLGGFLLGLCFLGPSATPLVAQEATGGGVGFSIQVGGGSEGGAEDVSLAIQLVFIMTLLALAPSIVIMMTSFLRIVIVLGFVRNAMGVTSAPSNQVIIGIALFLTFFLMTPYLERINEGALQPYRADEITSLEALDRAGEIMKEFMVAQTRPSDIEFFLDVAGMGPTRLDELPMRIVIPSFVLSELRTAFQMGFLIFLPFLVIDFLIASILMAMGMMMMPPIIVSLPFKILLFVLVDGWRLVLGSLVESFQ